MIDLINGQETKHCDHICVLVCVSDFTNAMVLIVYDRAALSPSLPLSLSLPPSL